MRKALLWTVAVLLAVGISLADRAGGFAMALLAAAVVVAAVAVVHDALGGGEPGVQPSFTWRTSARDGEDSSRP